MNGKYIIPILAGLGVFGIELFLFASLGVTVGLVIMGLFLLTIGLFDRGTNLVLYSVGVAFLLSALASGLGLTAMFM